jgi:putative transposase
MRKVSRTIADFSRGWSSCLPGAAECDQPPITYNFAAMYEYIDGLYFFTATCLEWRQLLLNHNYKQIILNSLSHASKTGICTIYGFVIMPNHIHLLIAIKDENIRTFQLSFMKFTAQSIIEEMRYLNDPMLSQHNSTQADRKIQFWERRPKWKSLITSEIFYQKLQYIHNNPLQERWKLVASPEEYAMSSANSYLQRKAEFDFLTFH